MLDIFPKPDALKGHTLMAKGLLIRKGAEIDDAVFESGFESHSGFREAFGKVFGTAPGRVKSADTENSACVQLAWIETPLGPMVAGSVDEKICLLEFTDRRMLEAQFRKLRGHLRLPMIPGDSAALRKLRTEIAEYFEGKRTEFTLPLAYRGSEFEETVWNQLLQIPAGETRSYQDIARALGNPKGSRAVGRANGMNRIAILIPCHRVVRSDGGLGAPVAKRT